MTFLTFMYTHKTLNVVLGKVGSFWIVIATFESWDDTFVGSFVNSTIGETAGTHDFHLVFFVTSTIKNNSSGFFGKLSDRDVDGKIVLLTDANQAFEPPRILGNTVEWTNAAFSDGKVFVEDEFWVDFHTRAKTGTDRTSTFWGVEREEAWGEFRDELVWVIFTSVALRISVDFGVFVVDHFFTNSGRSIVDFENLDDALAEIESLLDGVRDT